jgi:hypothetical protein
MIHVLGQTTALRELHPDRRQSDRKVCEWMLRQLGAQENPRAGSLRRSAVDTRLTKLPHYDELEYQVRTKRAILIGKQKEAALVTEYRDWLVKQGRKLEIVRYKTLRCDAYEAESTI